MAKLSEKHPRESEIAKKLLAEYRLRDEWGGIDLMLSRERADDLEMKICEALVEAQYTASRDAFKIAGKGGEVK